MIFCEFSKSRRGVGVILRNFKIVLHIFWCSKWGHKFWEIMQKRGGSLIQIIFVTILRFFKKYWTKFAKIFKKEERRRGGGVKELLDYYKNSTILVGDHVPIVGLHQFEALQLALSCPSPASHPTSHSSYAAHACTLLPFLQFVKQKILFKIMRTKILHLCWILQRVRETTSLSILIPTSLSSSALLFLSPIYLSLSYKKKLLFTSRESI